ncbi:FAD-dependent oxidoreductase [Chloroflexota bacterium]
MAKVVVIGGGIAGCGAALAARKAGSEVTLLERTDLLMGQAIIGPVINTNGKFTIAEEAAAMGGGDIKEIFESSALPSNEKLKQVVLDASKTATPQFGPEYVKGWLHGYYYDGVAAEVAIRKLLPEMGVQIRYNIRATDVTKVKNRLTAVKLANGDVVEGDAFVDCTGANCTMSQAKRYGNACVMCSFYRCPTFGDRVSIAGKAGAREFVIRAPDGTPGFSTALMVYKETLSLELQQKFREDARVIVPYKGFTDWVPDLASSYVLSGHRGFDTETGEPEDPRSCFRHPSKTGSMGFMDCGSSGFALAAVGPISTEKLRQLPGFEKAIKAHPQGDTGNFIRGLSVTPHDASLKVTGLENLFVAGEKTGCCAVMECHSTGLLAGHNAVRAAMRMNLLVPPRSTVIGDFVAFGIELNRAKGGQTKVYSCEGGLFFTRMIDTGLYTTDVEKIKQNVASTGLTEIYARKLT